MSKALTFTLGGKPFSLRPEKIDRKKIYGGREKLVFDDDNKECTLAYTDDTGTLVMPKGGVGLGIVSPEGEWVERSSLKARTLDGGDAALIPSSYDVPNALSKKVSGEEFLDYTVTAAYQLGGDSAFCTALGDDIYTFEYIYREGYETTSAFVLQSGGAAFLLLGYETGIEMLDLNQTAEIDAEDEEPDEDEDAIDFTMM
ncbi:MAG: hypothetical protein LBB82_02920 [Treponema sp.]|jgi:hypothetical protein|nr:hypothetical protein [Treponema sp.]